MRVAVIGAGWYGCHIAMQLKDKDVDVVIFEQSDEIFTGASRYNTGRLHQGFHYPRSGITRRQCRRGFNEFTLAYSEVCEEVNSNFYLLSETGSYIDFDTYIGILDNANLAYDMADANTLGFQHAEGVIKCEEMAVNPNKASDFFLRHLGNNLRLSTRVDSVVVEGNGVIVNGESFDYCIDCTYYTLKGVSYNKEVVYENIVTLLLRALKKDTDISFVVMDGPFVSLNKYFPKETEACYSLYHVKHSVVHESNDMQESLRYHKELSTRHTSLQADTQSILNDARYYYQNFDREFELSGSFLSIRTKLVNANASRECIVEQNGRIVHVLSGKINSVFEASEKVISILNLT